MKIVEFTAKTGSALDTLKTGKGTVEVYEDIEEVRANITIEHFDLLNAIIIIRAQDEVRKGLRDVPLSTLVTRELKRLKKEDPAEYATKQLLLLGLIKKTPPVEPIKIEDVEDDGFVIER